MKQNYLIESKCVLAAQAASHLAEGDGEHSGHDCRYVADVLSNAFASGAVSPSLLAQCLGILLRSREAYFRGRRARTEGIPDSQSPYEGSTLDQEILRSSWLEGWSSASLPTLPSMHTEEWNPALAPSVEIVFARRYESARSLLSAQFPGIDEILDRSIAEIIRNARDAKRLKPSKQREAYTYPSIGLPEAKIVYRISGSTIYIDNLKVVSQPPMF